MNAIKVMGVGIVSSIVSAIMIGITIIGTTIYNLVTATILACIINLI